MGRTIPGMLIAICTVCLFFLQAHTAYSQSKYIIRHFTNENGLPANGVKGIELDKKNGFLWVGTQAGLVRFDGKNFKNFLPHKNTAAAYRITVIGKNREGTIFSEDENFSVYRITHNQPEFVTTDTFLMDPMIVRGGNFPRRPAKKMADKLRQLPRSSFLLPWILFHEDTGDSSSFTFNYFGYACHYDATNDTLLFFPSGNNYQLIFRLDGRTYFVRENLEVWLYNDSLRQVLPVQVHNMPYWKGKPYIMPRFIWKPGMEAPLVVYKQDIWKLQHEGDALQLQPLCRSCCPPNADISTAQVWTEQGLIFLGSEVNGLYVIKDPFLHAVRTDTTTEAGRAEYAQVEIVPGIINTASGLAYSSKGTLLPRELHVQFPRSNIYQNKQGDLWYTSGDTIMHYQRADNRYTKMVSKGASKMVFAETQNRQYVISDLSIADITGNNYRLLYKLPYLANALKNSLNPTAAIEYKPGTLAIAAEHLLLYDTEKGGAPDTVPIPGLTAQVRSLLKFGDYLLIGTYGQGFYMYKNGTVKKMPLDKNSYLSTTHCFMPDSTGYCWISSNHGLFKVSLQALISAYENNLDEIYYHYFGKDDGIFNTEFNGGCQPCAIQLSSGLFSFPTMNGVVVFNPFNPHAPPPSGQIFVEEVHADTVRLRPADNARLTFPYHLRNLRFKLALPLFGNPENIYFSYKLEPYNDGWETQDILQNNVLQFGGLPPGDYKLYLRVRNGFGTGDYGATTIAFSILKPWYQSWWFVALVLLGFIMLVWAFVRWRTARIERRKEELQQLVILQTKNIEEQSRQLEHQLHRLQSQQQKLEEDNTIKARLIGIISHDMVSPIRFMGFLAKKLRDGMASSDQAYQTANAFVNVSQELESLSVNMLNWIRIHHGTFALKPEPFDLRELVNESTGIAATLAKEKGLRLHNDVPKNTRLWQYRQAIGVITYNLAMNAMKYTESGEIRIAGQPAENGYSITVSDTGVGMSPNLVAILNSPESFNSEYATSELKKFQFGYLIIKDLLNLVQGEMNVESTGQKGTRVTIRFVLFGEFIEPGK